VTTTTYEAGEIAPVTLTTRSKGVMAIIACRSDGTAAIAGYVHTGLITAHKRARALDAKAGLGTIHLVLPITGGKVEVPGRVRLPLSCGHVTVPLFEPEAATAREHGSVWCRECDGLSRVIPDGTAPCGQPWGHDAHLLTVAAPGAATPVYHCPGAEYPEWSEFDEEAERKCTRCREPLTAGHGAKGMCWIDTALWEPIPDQPGTSRKVGQRPVGEVFKDLKAVVGEAGPGHDEYFVVSMSADGSTRRYAEPWPEGTVLVFTRNGNSEGHVTQVAVVSGGGASFDVVLMAKTFDGADAAWQFGKDLAAALGVIW
jgi:hypothetical protein